MAQVKLNGELLTEVDDFAAENFIPRHAAANLLIKYGLAATSTQDWTWLKDLGGEKHDTN